MESGGGVEKGFSEVSCQLVICPLYILQFWYGSWRFCYIITELSADFWITVLISAHMLRASYVSSCFSVSLFSYWKTTTAQVKQFTKVNLVSLVSVMLTNCCLFFNLRNVFKKFRISLQAVTISFQLLIQMMQVIIQDIFVAKKYKDWT